MACDAPEGPQDGRVALSVAFGESQDYCDAGLKFRYAAAPIVREVVPSTGVARGDILRVAGRGFTDGTSCRIGAAPPRPALRLSSSLLECAVPSLQRGTHILRASNNGVDFGEGTAVATRGDPVTLGFMPPLGPATGGTSLKVADLALLGPHANLTCVLGGRSTPLLNDTCRAPPASSGHVNTSVNYVTGHVAARAAPYFYHAPLRIAGLGPSTGSIEGGTRVVLHLNGPSPSVIEARGGAYACAFGDAVHRAQIVNRTTIVCVAPSGVRALAHAVAQWPAGHLIEPKLQAGSPTIPLH